MEFRNLTFQKANRNYIFDLRSWEGYTEVSSLCTLFKIQLDSMFLKVFSNLNDSMKLDSENHMAPV